MELIEVNEAFEIKNISYFETAKAIIKAQEPTYRLLHKLDFDKEERKWIKEKIIVFPTEIQGTPRSVLGKSEFEWKPRDVVSTVLVDEDPAEIEEWRLRYLR